MYAVKNVTEQFHIAAHFSCGFGIWQLQAERGARNHPI
jgi:hypothetical protein